MKTWVVLASLLLGASASAEPLSFDAALSGILEKSAAVRNQRSVLEATRARNLPAKLFFTPSLGVDVTRTRGQTDLESGASNVSTRRDVEGTAALNLFRFGADLSGLSAANSDERRQEELLESVLLRTENDAVDALVALIQARLRVKILQSFVDLEQKSVDIAKQRYERGLLAIQEVEKVSIDLENTRAKQADAEVAESDAAAAVVALLGSDQVQTVWPWKEQLARADFGKELRSEPVRAERRPDYRAAQARVDAESSRYNRARLSLLPTLDTTYSYGWSHPYEGPQDYESSKWVVSLSIPLFNQLSDYGAARAQFQVRIIAETDLELLRREIQGEWSNAKDRFETILRSNMSRQKNLMTSRKLFDDSLARFKAGRSSTNDLFVDQSRLFDSELLALQSQAQAHTALSRLCQVSGRRLNECLK